jgi:hypothetical protein
VTGFTRVTSAHRFIQGLTDITDITSVTRTVLVNIETNASWTYTKWHPDQDPEKT